MHSAVLATDANRQSGLCGCVTAPLVRAHTDALVWKQASIPAQPDEGPVLECSTSAQAPQIMGCRNCLDCHMQETFGEALRSQSSQRCALHSERG